MVVIYYYYIIISVVSDAIMHSFHTFEGHFPLN